MRKGAATALRLVAVVFPIYVLVGVLKATGVLGAVAPFFSPLMRFLGLPGEAALVIIAGNLANIYAGLAVLGPLGLSAKQVTVVGLMLGLSHTQILESAVLHQMGARPLAVALYRLAISVAAGLLVNWMMPG